MLRHLQLVVDNDRSVDLEAAGILPVCERPDLDLSTSLWNLLQVPEGRREDFDKETSGMEAKRTTVMVLELEHKGEMPVDLADKIGQRIYDLCSTRGLVVLPTIRIGYDLKVKEQA